MTATVETVVSTAIMKGRLILLLKIHPTAWRKGVCQNYRGAVKESLSKDETQPRNARSMQSSTMPISEPRLTSQKTFFKCGAVRGRYSTFYSQALIPGSGSGKVRLRCKAALGINR